MYPQHATEANQFYCGYVIKPDKGIIDSPAVVHSKCNQQTSSLDMCDFTFQLTAQSL